MSARDDGMSNTSLGHRRESRLPVSHLMWTIYMSRKRLPDGRTKTKLSAKQVTQYEKMSGFKTTGDVYIYESSNASWEAYQRLLMLENEPWCPDEKAFAE